MDNEPVDKWVRASDEHPLNWFEAKLRNIEQDAEINMEVKAVYKTSVEFETNGNYRSLTYINNISWLKEIKPVPVADEEFKWIDELVKDMIYRKLPVPDHYIANVQKCLDEYKSAAALQYKPGIIQKIIGWCDEKIKHYYVIKNSSLVRTGKYQAFEEMKQYVKSLQLVDNVNL